MLRLTTHIKRWDVAMKEELKIVYLKLSTYLTYFLFPCLAFSKQNTSRKLSELRHGWKKFLFLPSLLLVHFKSGNLHVSTDITFEAILSFVHHLDV